MECIYQPSNYLQGWLPNFSKYILTILIFMRFHSSTTVSTGDEVIEQAVYQAFEVC